MFDYRSLGSELRWVYRDFGCVKPPVRLELMDVPGPSPLKKCDAIVEWIHQMEMRWNDSQMSQDIFHHFSILQAMNGPEAGTSFDFLHNLQWFITRLSSYSQRKWYTLCSDNPIVASVISVILLV